tara:strand:- start:2066 stop:2182 length:117 start_codon:yes stop_codon:yes gene_type:complete
LDEEEEAVVIVLRVKRNPRFQEYYILQFGGMMIIESWC